MWQLFWIQNIHYILEIFVAFLMVTAGWIYFDGWLVERRWKTFVRALGFFVLTAWSFLDAAPVSIISAKSFPYGGALQDIVGLLGFSLVFLSLVVDPVPVKPGEKPIFFFSRLWEKSFAFLPFSLPPFAEIRAIIKRVLFPLISFFGFIAAILIEPKVWMTLVSAGITFLLWLHYGRGIQREWRFFYLGFLWVTIALLFSSFQIWQGTTNVLTANLLAPFHIIWVMEHTIKFIGAILLGVWAWGFIRFRLFPQLFSSFVALAFLVFIIMTITYTGFLLNRTQASIITNLETNVKTLDFALRKVKESAILASRIASTNPQVREAVKRQDRDALFKNLNALMFENATDFMLAVNTGGEVLMRGEDKERFGDSIADDPVVWRALDGKAVVTTNAEKGVTLSIVAIKAASPIVDTTETGDQQIVGAVVTGFLIDTAFVDGIKKITGLDITVYASDISSASTFTVPQSQLRLVGIRELNPKILDTVLKQNKTFTGPASIINRPFLAAYIPIQDIEETTVGMFFTGISQSTILAAVSDTMQLTFAISIGLMILSLLPLWWLARFISYNQQV